MKFNSLRYIKHIRTTGAVSASSIFVIKSMTNNITPKVPQIIVELGAGTGNVTAYILKKMHPASKLYCFEIDPSFTVDLEEITDPRFFLIKESALDILKYIDVASVDIIISTLPLTLFKPEERRQLLTDCRTIMKPEGVLRQFLYSFQKKYFRAIFDEINTHIAVINLPPAVIYCCSNK